MTLAEAKERAIRAVRRACDESDQFGHGDMASGDIMTVIERAISDEFLPAWRNPGMEPRP